MNYEMITIRIIHILFGVFWAGSAIFLAFILQPTVRTLGTDIQSRVMSAVGAIAGPALLTSGIITILSGLALTIRLRWGMLDTLFETGWGWAMMIGFLTSIGALYTGIIVKNLIGNMSELGKEFGKRGPTAEETNTLQKLGNRIPRLTRATAVMVIIAICTMASARFL